MSKHDIATLISMLKDMLQDNQRKSLERAFLEGEIWNALKQVGKKTWVQYDPMLTSWSRICAAFDKKSTNVDNLIRMTILYAPAIKKEDLWTLNQRKLRLLMGLKFESEDRKVEFLHAMANMPYSDCKDMIREAKGQKTTSTCEHSKIEVWNHCAECDHWHKV